MQFRSGQDKLVRVALSVGGRGSVDGGGKKLNMYEGWSRKDEETHRIELIHSYSTVLTLGWQISLVVEHGV
jgi:hypothetical protein